MLPCVSVIIATRGRGDVLMETLAPLLADPSLLELVLVFDDDPPAAAAAAAAVEDPRVRVLEVRQQNKAAARQAGVLAARGTVLLFLDDDVVLEEGGVSSHAGHHHAPGKIVVGYMPIPASRQRGTARFPSRSYARSYESNCAGWERDPDRILPTLWGGNLSMRREDALRVGLHNPELSGRYYEDCEFGMRCREAGLTGVFDRGLRGAHLHQRTVGRWIEELRLNGVSHEELGISAPARRGDVLAPVLSPVMVAALYVISAARLRWLEGPVSWRLRTLQARRGARDERERRARAAVAAAGAPLATGAGNRSVHIESLEHTIFSHQEAR